jgi:hypothetical protein
VRGMRAFYAFPPPRFRIVPANPCPPHRATRSTDLLNVRCQPHPQRRTLRAHATASGRQNWDNQRWSFARGGSGPILRYTGSSFPSLVHQGHSFTLTDLPPACCSSCGCLRASGWIEPASLTSRRRERSRWWSVSRHLFLLLSKADAKRCLPGRMSAKVDHNPSCSRTD